MGLDKKKDEVKGEFIRIQKYISDCGIIKIRALGFVPARILLRYKGELLWRTITTFLPDTLPPSVDLPHI